MSYSLSRQYTAEALGTAFLLAIGVGSGIMGERLAGSNQAIALLCSTLATGSGLIVLIRWFGPISGAHLNPVVTLFFLFRKEMELHRAFGYVLMQLMGAIIGVWAAHLMFGEPLLQVSHTLRSGLPQGFAECVATFGLLGCIAGVQRAEPSFTPTAVGLYITSAYWFTASTSFANPAVTLARCFTDTFSGIAPVSMPWFLAGQGAGLLVAYFFLNWFLHEET